MKLVTFYQVQRARIGILNEEKNEIFPISKILNMEKELLMTELIEKWNDNIYLKLKNHPKNDGISLNDVKLAPPIPHPMRVFCVGKNYVEHVKEVDSTIVNTDTGIPDSLIFFTKHVNRAVGPEGIINSHKDITQSLDYESELAIIIGKEGINISKEKASDYIFGYTILNDISARNIQKQHIQWVKGKSLDDTCPIGPCIVTSEEIKLPLNLKIGSKVNDEIRQNSKTTDMIWGIEEIIEELSKGMTLKKGDIIATGTPSGVGMGFKPPKFLKPGDIIECNIENIGILKNYIK